MGWTIFLTTIPADQCDFATLLAVYGLRWRIEIIFKAWKSHLRLEELHRVNETHLRILLSVRLLIITALTNVLYKAGHQRLRELYGRELSLMKFINYLVKNTGQIQVLCHSITNFDPRDRIWEALLKYCCHDKRKRLHFWDIYTSLLLT